MSISNRTERARRGDSLVSGRSAVRILLLLLGLGMGILTMLSAPQVLHAQSPTVDVRLLPASTSTAPGGTTSLTVQVEPNGQEVNGVDICVTFPPGLLQVVDADAGASGVQIQADTGTLDIALLNTVDNTAGVIKYSAGTFGSAPSTTFTLATIGLQAANVNDEATVAFSTSASGCGATPTDAVIGGDAVLRDTFGSTVTLGFGPDPLPTLTSVSIDSDNEINSGTNETAKVGDTVTLSFTADKTIQAPTVTVTVGGVSAAGSVSVTNVSGNNWTATFDLSTGDTEGVVAFTIDFSDTTGNAGTQVTSTTDSTSVTLVTVPGPPSGVSAISGDRQALVSWTAPASDGGSPITKYTVFSSPGGVTATTTGTSVTVAGLSNGTVYTFTVTATNSAGSSLSAIPSTAVTAGLTPPVVYSQEVSTTAGVPVIITLTGSDVNGDTLGWAIIEPVTGGLTDYVAMSQKTNTIDVVFTPNSGFIGTASFMFYATDASSASNTATVNINVSPAATPTPAPASAVATPTPIPNLWDAPSTSSWGLAALVAGMLVVLVIALRLTSGSRRTARQ